MQSLSWCSSGGRRRRQRRQKRQRRSERRFWWRGSAAWPRAGLVAAAAIGGAAMVAAVTHRLSPPLPSLLISTAIRSSGEEDDLADAARPHEVAEFSSEHLRMVEQESSGSIPRSAIKVPGYSKPVAARGAVVVGEWRL